MIIFLVVLMSWLHNCCRKWEGEPLNPFNHADWVTIVAPTDRPKSVRNRCVIGLFVSSLCNFDLHFLSIWGVCHATVSDLFHFLFPSSLQELIPLRLKSFSVSANKHAPMHVTRGYKQFAMISLPLNACYYIWNGILPNIRTTSISAIFSSGPKRESPLY